MVPKLFNRLSLLTILMVFSASQLFAQAPDTVDVKWSSLNQGYLNSAIQGDTTATGERVNPNRVYRLERNKIYFLNAPLIATDWHFSLIAAEPTGPDDKSAPPVIMPGKDDQGNRPNLYVWAGGDVTIKGIWFYAYLTDPGVDQRTSDDGFIFAVGDSTRIIIQNNIFDGAHVALSSKGMWQDWLVENNHARNLLGNYSWYIGHFMHHEKVPGDTFIVRNNTMFNCGGFTWAVPLEHFLLFEHNTVIGNHVNPFIASGDWPGGVNRIIKNNIFYATFAKGCKEVVKDGVVTYTENWTCTDGYHWALTDVDTLEFIYNIDSLYAISEKQRRIQWENNAYFWPKPLTDMYAKHADSLIAPKWANEHSAAFYGNPEYPNMIMSGNIEADPGFNADVMANMQDLADYIEGFQMNWVGSPQAADFVPYFPTAAAHNPLFAWYPPFAQWPLPENLSYTNAALLTAGTDGFPLGDLNWFPDKKAQWLTNIKETGTAATPAKFTLNQNYPNPFNPTTNISFNLGKSERVTLAVYNMLGQKIKTLVDKQLPAGAHQITWNGKDEAGRAMASGVYYYRLETESQQATKKMLLLK